MNIENENENENENSAFPSFSSLLCNFGNNDVQLQLQMANPDLSFPASINASSILDCPIPGLFSTAATTTTTTTTTTSTSMNENTSQKRISNVSVPQTQSGSVHEVATMEQSTRDVKRRKAKCSGEQRHHLRPRSEKPSVTHEKPVCDLQAPVRRSQRLGDRIAALQKLVSPFGKTDTASVLHEAYVNIKLLQEQVQMLSAAYFRTNLYRPQGIGAKEEDLRSRGLCLVPIPFTQNLNTEEKTERSLAKRI